MTDQVELYGARSCPYTAELRERLFWDDKAFVEYDVEQDPAALERMIALTSGQRTIPVLVEAGKVTQVGWQGRGCIVAVRGSTAWQSAPDESDSPG